MHRTSILTNSQWHFSPNRMLITSTLNAHCICNKCSISITVVLMASYDKQSSAHCLHYECIKNIDFISTTKPSLAMTIVFITTQQYLCQWICIWPLLPNFETKFRSSILQYKKEKKRSSRRRKNQQSCDFLCLGWQWDWYKRVERCLHPYPFANIVSIFVPYP